MEGQGSVISRSESSMPKMLNLKLGRKPEEAGWLEAVVVAGAPKENPPDEPVPAPNENPDIVQGQSGVFKRSKRLGISALTNKVCEPM